MNTFKTRERKTITKILGLINVYFNNIILTEKGNRKIQWHTFGHEEKNNTILRAHAKNRIWYVINKIVEFYEKAK